MRRLASATDKLFRHASFSRSEKPERGDKSKSSRGIPSSTSNEPSASGFASSSNSNNYSDAPPAYTYAPASLSPSGSAPPPALALAPQPTQQLTAGVHGGVSDNDIYANLANFDIVLLIDDSGSMAGSLWREAEAALKSLALIVTTYDQDGIDMYFLNHQSGISPSDNLTAKHGYYNVTRKDTVEAIFRGVNPSGPTYTGKRLEQLFRPYLRKLELDEDTKPINVIVITDGAPSDNVEQAIKHTVKELDRLRAPSYQAGIQFIQIGSDPQATRALQHLDDGLSQSGIRDIVDTTPCQWEDAGRHRVKTLTGAAILKIVLGAVDKRIDDSRLGSNK